jgi:hypothetical protein
MIYISPLRNHVFNFSGTTYNPEEVAQWVAKYFGNTIPADKDQTSTLKEYYTKVMLFLTDKNLPVSEESIATNKSTLDLFIQKPLQEIQTEIEAKANTTPTEVKTCTGNDECLKCKIEKHKKLLMYLVIGVLLIFVVKKIIL